MSSLQYCNSQFCLICINKCPMSGVRYPWSGGNLNADYTLNYPYWYDMYSYTSKNLIVLRKRKEKGALKPLTELGECVCQGKVINFLKNTDKKCFCNEGCASVRFKAVF